MARDASAGDDDLGRLARQVESFRLLRDSGVVGVISGSGSVIEEANDAFLGLVGYAAEDVASGALDWGTITPPELTPLDDEMVRMLLDTGVARPFEKEYIHRAGHRVRVLVGAVALERDPLRWMALVSDITARAAAERQAELIAHLATRLSTASTPAEVAQVIVADVTPALGGRSGGVALIDHSGAELRFLVLGGLDEASVRRWSSVPVGADRPLVEPLRTGTATFIRSPAELARRYPQVAADPFAADDEAWAFLPLWGPDLTTNATGLMSISYAEPQAFDPAQRTTLLAVAGICSQALTRALQAEQTERARLGHAFESLLDLVTIESAIRDDDGRIVDFRIEYMNDVAIDVAGRRRDDLVGSTVLEMYPAMEGSDLFAGYVHTVETGEPTVVESLPYEDVVDGRPVRGFYTVRVTRFEDGILIATRDISERERSRFELEKSQMELEAGQRLAHIGSWRWDIRSNELQWSTEMRRILGWDPDAPPPDRDVALAQLVAPADRERFEALTVGALATTGSFAFETQVVRTDGTLRDVIGNAEVVAGDDGEPTLMWGTCQDVTEQREAEQTLERQTAELSRERAATELLQRAILPAALPRVTGLELDGHYLPAGERGLVGGDWFDAFVLPDGAVGLVVGDVAGHGFAAAGLMGQLRNALRAYAFAGSSPAEVFTLLDQLLVAIEPDAMATCVYATYDPATGDLRCSRAGHPPPVLVAGGRSELLWGTSSPPLGTRATRDYVEAVTTVPVGGVAVLYSDGLIERRGEVIDVGLDRLAAALIAWSAPTIAGLGKHLAGELLDGPADDDLCTLALRRTR